MITRKIFIVKFTLIILGSLFLIIHQLNPMTAHDSSSNVISVRMSNLSKSDRVAPEGIPCNNIGARIAWHCLPQPLSNPQITIVSMDLFHRSCRNALYSDVCYLF